MGMAQIKHAKYQIGQVVQHRLFPLSRGDFRCGPGICQYRGMVSRTFPEDARPRRDQPFYHLLAENGETEYVAYVSEQNLVPDLSGEPLRHPQIDEMFDRMDNGTFG
ncbi:heat shock protein HspQ [Brucella abortus]|nr:heat shock protein HspQ [Brucella abortus]